jgi:hypothetical protein
MVTFKRESKLSILREEVEMEWLLFGAWASFALIKWGG